MSKHFYKLDLHVDVEPLRQALHKKSYLFGEYPYRGLKGSPHEEMKDIWLRFNDIAPFIEKGNMDGFSDPHFSIWYPSYKELPESTAPIFDVMAHVRGEQLGGVLITKLPPGNNIRRHTDHSWHASFYEKYYVPIQNEDGATFNFDDGTIKPKQGDVYWFRNSVPHWVENRSNVDRIAMIICIKPNRG